MPTVYITKGHEPQIANQRCQLSLMSSSNLFVVDMTQKIDNTSAFLHHTTWPLLWHWLGETDLPNYRYIATSQKYEDESQLKHTSLLRVGNVLVAENKPSKVANVWKLLQLQHLEDMSRKRRDALWGDKDVSVACPGEEEEGEWWWQQCAWPERGPTPGNRTGYLQHTGNL